MNKEIHFYYSKRSIAVYYCTSCQLAFICDASYNQALNYTSSTKGNDRSPESQKVPSQDIQKKSILFLFAITAANVVPCGGPQKSPRSSSIVQIVFSFWSFEVSDSILRNQKIITGLNTFSNQRLI